MVSTLDDIDWILNLRGKDIPFNPVFISYLIFLPSEDGQHSAKLFIDQCKVADEDIKAHLSENRVQIFGYNEIYAHLQEMTVQKLRIGYDENVCNQKLYEEIKDAEPKHFDALIEHVKALKNPVEMEGMRNANIKSCVSLIQYFAWMEDYLKRNPDQEDMNEYTAAKKLEEFRMTRDLYMGASFDTISSIGPNGAVIHYKPKKGSSLKMTNTEIYLLDSGV